MASTQKARGLKRLGWFAQVLGRGIHYTHHEINRADYIINQSDGMLHAILAQLAQYAGMDEKVFVRPCPSRPRHGFVDSTAIAFPSDNLLRQEAADKLREIAQATLAADPDGEIAITPFLPSKANAVITPTMLTLGLGHDGATAGRASISLPIPTKTQEPWRGMLETVGVSKSESPYFEFIHSEIMNSVYLTQVRAGPKVEAGDDYIPRDTRVTCVVEIDGSEDLLEWEERVKKFATGTVVWHPGGSIASHFGVHCVLNKVPYVTSVKPVMWTKLQRTARAQWTTEDYEHVARLARAYDQHTKHDSLFSTNKVPYAEFVIGGLHAMGSLMQSRTEYCFRAAAATLVMAARAFSAVAIGEMRHATDDSDYDSPVQRFSEKISYHDRVLNGHATRNDVYETAMSLPLNELLERVVWSYYGYSQPSWHAGYGGPPWAECAASTVNYGLALAKFLSDPSENTFRHATQLLNEAVNKAHNNGWWLNKLMDEQVMHRLSARPATGFISSIAYDLLTANLPDDTQDDYSEVEWYLSEVENEARRMLRELPGYQEADSGFSLGILRTFSSTTKDMLVNYAEYAHPAYITPSGKLALPTIRTKAKGNMVYADFDRPMRTLLGAFGESLFRPKGDQPVMWVGKFAEWNAFVFVPWNGRPREVFESIPIWANMKRYWMTELGGFVFTISACPFPLRVLGRYDQTHPAPRIQELFSACEPIEYPEQPTALPEECLFFWDIPPKPIIVDADGVSPKRLVREWEIKRNMLDMKEPF